MTDRDEGKAGRWQSDMRNAQNSFRAQEATRVGGVQVVLEGKGAR